MTIDTKEVVRAGLQLERDGRAFYLDVAKKTKSVLARKMFESLADDEFNHFKWIQALEPGVERSESANRDLYARLEPIFANVSEAERTALASSPTDIRAIDIALDKEKQSVDAYDKWAAESADLKVVRLCTTLAGIERFHIQVFTNMREYLDRTADWFMKEEHWNFEGA